MTNAVDWASLVALAMGDAETPPQPALLHSALTQWGRAFEYAEGGPPLEADFPEPVREFFAALARASPTKPRKGQEVVTAARKAWRANFLREAYEDVLPMVQVAKELGVEFSGELQGAGKPSETAREYVAKQAGMNERRLRKVWKSR